MTASAPGGLFPIRISDELVAKGPQTLVRWVLDEADKFVAEKAYLDEEAAADFRMACDALGYWRMARRLELEAGDGHRKELKQTTRHLREAICERRGYALDDFKSAMEATEGRVRLPWGLSPLDVAMKLADIRPVKLLQPEVAGAALPTLIASVAFHLNLMDEKKVPGILLPVDAIREKVKQRKVVVAGAITRLIKAGIIKQTSKRHHTGRAREFEWSAREGVDYSVEDQSA